MRLLYVITNCDLGGAQSHLLDLLDGFQGGNEVLVAYGEPGPMLEALAMRNVRAIRLPSLVRRMNPLQDFAATKQLLGVLRELHPTIVHAHSSKAGLIARLACQIARIPVVFSAHGWGFSSGVPVGRRVLMWIIEALCMPMSSAVVTTCTADLRAAKRLLPFSGKRVFLIFNGIRDRKCQMRRLQDLPVITMIARFSEQKDHLTLLKAFRPLRTRARLLLVGAGPALESCIEYARKNDLVEGVTFAGERSDIDQILSGTDILALITHYEGLPISVLLGMRDAIPVVATRVGGIPDQIDDEISGLLVNRKDVAALHAALARLAGSAELRSRLGLQGRMKYESEFSYQTMVEQTKQVYAAALGR